ncbi:MAG: hypothetical protein ACFFG0_11470 [Candidatus Thorarchaeota archaeon]
MKGVSEKKGQNALLEAMVSARQKEFQKRVKEIQRRLEEIIPEFLGLDNTDLKVKNSLSETEFKYNFTIKFDKKDAIKEIKALFNTDYDEDAKKVAGI